MNRDPTTAVAAPRLACEAVTVELGRRLVLDEVTFTLAPGITCLIGRNGAGKTTLLRTLTGILPPRSGHVRIGGNDPFAEPACKREVGYLTHRPSLHQRLTVEENLRFWTRVIGLDWRANSPYLEALAERLGIRTLFGQAAGTLSRGQQQRVAIARTLLARPSIIVMDEPTTGLDALAIREFHAHVLELAADEVCVLLATHSLDEALRLGGNFLLLAEGRALHIDRTTTWASDGPRELEEARLLELLADLGRAP